VLDMERCGMYEGGRGIRRRWFAVMTTNFSTWFFWAALRLMGRLHYLLPVSVYERQLSSVESAPQKQVHFSFYLPHSSDV
jgi:hypothetical protein